MEALKKVAVRIVKLLITDSFEEGSEVLIDAQWLGRIREEIEEVKKTFFLFFFTTDLGMLMCNFHTVNFGIFFVTKILREINC